jgi:hypothetical protein
MPDEDKRDPLRGLEQLRQPVQAKKVPLTAENPLELDVVYKGENRLLNGHPDYSVWYDIRPSGRDESGNCGGQAGWIESDGAWAMFGLYG